MSRIIVDEYPSDLELEALAATAPDNPFLGPGYARFRRSRGCTPLLLTIDAEDGRGIRLLGFERSGRVRRTIEIPSTPPLGSSIEPWVGLLDCSRARTATDLVIGTFGSKEGSIPPLSGEVLRRPRAEYVIDLGADDLLAALGSNHRRNVRRGDKAGLSFRASTTGEAAERHAALTGHSMDRRRRRGEEVGGGIPAAEVRGLLQAGIATVFQALWEGDVVASVVVLRSRTGAYYYSSGNAPEGMERGASHWLVYRIMNALREDGTASFNLAGTSPDNVGLERFKAGFGARRIALESLRVRPAPFWRQAARRAIRRVIPQRATRSSA